MIFQRTPFEHIKRKLQKWQAIVDPSFTILYPENLSIEAKDVLQVGYHVILALFQYFTYTFPFLVLSSTKSQA